MKFLFAFFSIILSAGASAVDWSAGPMQTFPGFFVIRSADCKSAFYVARRLLVDQARSAVIENHGLAQTSVLLTAQEPSVAESAEILAWAKASGCADADINLIPYASINTEISVQLSVPVRGFQILDVTDRGDGTKLLRFTINIGQLNLAGALSAIRSFQPNVSAHIFRPIELAEASLSVDYSAAATFLETHYTEKTCTQTEDCDHLFIWKRCETHEFCVGTPRVLQQLKDAGLTTGFVLDGSHIVGVPDSDVDQLQEQLLSRLLLSVFVQKSVSDQEGIMTIILGDLDRTVSGHYEDRVSNSKIEDLPFSVPMETVGLSDFIEPQLKLFYRKAGK